MSKRAIILAGGKGTRLKPYTITLPKPLVPVGEMPILEIIIRQLKKSGFDHITLTVSHLAEIIKAFFGDGSKWGIKIDYTYEDKPLSTMGPLTLIPDLPENFLVMNGDILSDIDYGVLKKDEQNRLVDFEEKPSYDFLVSMGIYIVNKEVVKCIPDNTFFGFDHLMYELIKKSEFPYLYEYEGYWLDIGRPDDYEIAIEKVESGVFPL